MAQIKHKEIVDILLDLEYSEQEKYKWEKESLVLEVPKKYGPKKTYLVETHRKRIGTRRVFTIFMEVPIQRTTVYFIGHYSIRDDNTIELAVEDMFTDKEEARRSFVEKTLNLEDNIRKAMQYYGPQLRN